MWPLSCPLHCTPFTNVLNLLDCSSRKFPTLSSNCLFLFKITHMLASLYSSVRTGACLCAHRETSASDPETIPAAGGHTAYLSGFAVVPSPFAELSFCPCLWLRASETRSKHVSALRAEEALGGHHAHPLRCSLSPQPFSPPSPAVTSSGN